MSGVMLGGADETSAGDVARAETLALITCVCLHRRSEVLQQRRSQASCLDQILDPAVGRQGRDSVGRDFATLTIHRQKQNDECPDHHVPCDTVIVFAESRQIRSVIHGADRFGCREGGNLGAALQLNQAGAVGMTQDDGAMIMTAVIHPVIVLDDAGLQFLVHRRFLSVEVGSSTFVRNGRPAQTGRLR